MIANGVALGNFLGPIIGGPGEAVVGFMRFQVREIPRTLYDMYSLDGFEKWTKAWSSQMRLLYFIIPEINGIFDKCLETLRLQIDLYYATSFISSTADLIANKNGERGQFLKILSAVGNVLDTFKFLQKYEVFSFSTCSKWASSCGSYQVYGMRLDKMPILRNTVFDKPKDLCIFIGSICESYLLCEEVYDDLGNSFIYDWEKRYKLIGHLGKLLLIGLGPYYYKTGWYAGIDFVTQHVSLFGFILKKQKERDERFNLAQRIPAPAA